MSQELEAKFALSSCDALRARLSDMGVRIKELRFERNAVFDTPQRSLRAKGELLRLRHCGRSVLTWKKPVSPPGPAGIKAMEEVQTDVADFEAMRAILLGLGYSEALWYEKCREQWLLEEALVCLDVLPFGDFAEIEGSPQSIAAAAGRLGLDMAGALALTYHDIHQQYLSRMGLPPQDSFVFSAQHKDRLRGICLDIP